MQDGELSVSRRCKTRGTMQMLSWVGSESPEDCSAALGRPVVMQIYAPPVYSNTKIGLKRLLWGLGSFGEPGVAKVLELLQYELKMTMGNVGAATLADIDKNYVECDWDSPLPV
jgi:isopentenyl diphosphate isomerase/L-lactate dehydrogenase-like FMN-dependent dehydrogenase